MRKPLLSIIIILLQAAILRPAFAQDGVELSVKGFVDSYHALRTESPGDWMSSRTRLRTEATLEKGGAGIFASANLVYNAVLKDMSGLQLREAYSFWGSEHWDIRAGKQIITWGVADGLRVTDVISPMDYTEFLAQDYDDIRIPVGAVRVRYSRDKWSLDAVAVPVPEFFRIPMDARNPWSVGAAPLGDEPLRRACNMEYGARLSFFLSGVDFSLTALHTWNKMPELRGAMFVYHRLGVFGGDVSIPLGKFVIRAEAADYLDDLDVNTANGLIGIDWYPGNDWNVSAQYNHNYRMSGSERNTALATFRLSKALLGNTLNLSTFAYVDVTDGGVFNRLSADYAVSDQVHAILGYDYFHADKGMFKLYAHNSEIWMKLKYSF